MFPRAFQSARALLTVSSSALPPPPAFGDVLGDSRDSIHGAVGVANGKARSWIHLRFRRSDN
jgi:hypothetical protein